MGDLYQQPKYYEIAYSFRDLAGEVDVFDDLIGRYSRIRVTRMLEIGCGPATHLPELARRGYAYAGLDLSPAMLAYARDRAQRHQASANFVEADMRNFRLPEPAEFAFVLTGSLYVQTATDLTAHFDAMAHALRPGGLYLLDWCINFTPLAGRLDTWSRTRNGTIVTNTYRATRANAVEQTVEEDITLAVEESGRKMILRDVTIRREIHPQEFLLFLAQRPDFEFIGWWNNWDVTQPLDGTEATIYRPITVVRRV